MAVTKQVVISGMQVMAHFPSWHAADGVGLRGIIACHGHGGQDVQIEQGGPFCGHPEFLADQGYVVACISTTNLWLSPTAMADITALYDWLISLGIQGSKVGLLCWSMGGGHGLRWLIENPTKVAVGFMCSPLTDLDWAYSANAGWATEMDAAYGTYASANGSARSPIKSAAALRGGAKILISHATNDATLPYSQTQAFIAAVNDSAIQERQPVVTTGDHQGGLTQVKPRESWEWIRTQWSA